MFESACNVGIYKKHGNNKQWIGKITFYKQTDGSFKAQFNEVFLNRSGYKLVAFNSESCNNISQHNSAR